MLGRVWCGWACPQTVYMEFVYRPIERFFGGAPGRAKNALQRSPAAPVMKVVAYLIVSCLLAHTFLAYFVGIDRLIEWVQLSPFEHPTPFMVMAVTTGLMLFDFAYFREQTCIVACPYGRFQSVMLDRQSKIISYDRHRGEPRGQKKSAGKNAGKKDVSLSVLAQPEGTGSRTADCVDCKLCVTTCPTGIDIRDGLQMECINCAQCIDACDAVMTKLSRPTGLIRYSSLAAMEGEKSRFLRARVIVYPAILLILVTAFITVLLTKEDTDANFLRGLGAPFVMLPDEMIGNQLRVKLVNRRDAAATYSIRAEGPEGTRDCR
jgi:cytochrome c oxidase accessory protein FixG